MTISPPPADPTPATPGIPAGWYHDATSGRMRWWDGSSWTENFQQQTTSNGFAVAALILGIAGILLTPIPLFIGLFLGGPLNILAILFGILGMIRANKLGGLNMGMAVAGFVLGMIAFISIFFGAGTIW